MYDVQSDGFQSKQSAFQSEMSGVLCIQYQNSEGVMWVAAPNFYFPFANYPYLAYSPYLQPTEVIETIREDRVDNSANKTQSHSITLDQRLILDVEDLREVEYDPKKKGWSDEEDKMLLFLKKKMRLSWEVIADRMEGRNKKMCYSRYKRIKTKSNTILRQSDEGKLRRLLQGARSARDDATERGERRRDSEKMKVEEREGNEVEEAGCSCHWTIQEDLVLIDFLNSYGKDWAMAQQTLPHKTINQLKNRYYGKLRKLNAVKLAHRALSQQ